MGKNRRAAYSFFSLVCVFIVLSCGGSSDPAGSGGAPTANIAPAVISSNPPDGAAGVATDSTIEATFNKEMDRSTVNAATFTVSTGGSNVPGTVAYDSATWTATFTPSASLALAARYTANITTGVKDVYGSALPASHTWTFTFRDGTWGAAAAISPIGGNAENPKIAMDASGNAIAVWEQNAGSGLNVWASRFVAGTGWGTPAIINQSASAHNPQIAMDASGNAIMVWVQSNTMWVNRYITGTGWGTPALVGAGTDIPQVAMNSSGNAFVVWAQYDEYGAKNAWAMRYDAGTDWGTPARINIPAISNNTNNYPRVAMDASGNAIALWSGWDGARGSVWANRYVTGTGWGSPARIDNATATEEAPEVTDIAMDTGGNAFAVWLESGRLLASRYVTGAGWGAPVSLDDDSVNPQIAVSPKIAVDESGNAIAVWHTDGNLGIILWTSRYEAGTGWGIPQNPLIALAHDPQIAMDARGNALAVWQDETGFPEDGIWVYRYVAGTGWGEPGVLHRATGATPPQIGMDSRGSAIAVWSQAEGGQNRIFADRFN